VALGSVALGIDGSPPVEQSRNAPVILGLAALCCLPAIAQFPPAGGTRLVRVVRIVAIRFVITLAVYVIRRY